MKNILRNMYSIWFKFKHRKVAVIGGGCVFGLNSRVINKTGIKDAITIGDNVMMHGTIIVEGNGSVKLNDKVNIRRETYLGSTCSIIIGEGTIISDNVSIMDNNNHPTKPDDRKQMVASGWSTPLWSWVYSDGKPVSIGSNVWICQGAKVLKGVTIVENSIIATAAVVTHGDSNPGVFAGNPAVIVKRI